MTNYKEIVTKAIIGKSKKISRNEYKIIPEEHPNTVLGCWIINHYFKGTNNNGNVIIDGSFDINVWYSYDNDTKTKVINQTFLYQDMMPVKIKESSSIDNNSEIIVRSLRQPTVTEVNIVDGQIVMTVEKELGVEIVGDTKLKISVEDLEDDYELIEDNSDLEEVKENFLES